MQDTTADGSPAPVIESTRSLVVVNVLTILMALVFDWPPATLMFPYWVQSVVIGYFSRKRMLALQNYSTEGLKINDKAVEPTEETKRSTANFFALHYGFFHLGYLAFLMPAMLKLPVLEWLGVAAAALSFIWNHRESFERNLEADQRGCPNLGFLMFLPYARILPMHFTIILGGASGIEGGFAIVLFGTLKTLADVFMHKFEHKMLQKIEPEKAAAG